MAPERLEAALGELLALHPDAPLTAVNEYGLFIPLPPSFDAAGHSVIDREARSALDLVVPADRVVIIAAWQRTKAVGAARASVHLLTRPEQPVLLTMFDLRPTHGVLMVVFTEEEGEGDVLVELAAAQAVRPRSAVQRKNEVAVFVDVDDATTELLGVPRDEIVGHGSLDFVHPDDQQRSITAWLDLLGAPGAARRVRLRHRRGDGSWIWLELTNHNLLDHPDYHCVVTEMLDISDEIAAQEAVRAREELLRRLTETIPLGVLQVDRSGTVVYTNERLHQILGRGAAAGIEEQLDTVAAADRPRVSQAVAEVVTDGSDRDLEVRVEGDSDGFRLCRVSIRGLHDASGVEVLGVIICVDDITESARLRSELEDRATYDVLTRCLNRASVMAVLDATLAEGKRTGVVFIDLDRFKQVNDVLGHTAGDELLVAAAERLQAAVRGTDVVGRLGGDEFLVVCPRLNTGTELVAIAERIVDSFQSPVELSGAGRVGLRASIGVALSDEGDDADTLVANADVAMYESKRQGSAPVVYAPRLRIGLAGGLEDERSLRRAIEHGDLTVHYQPAFDVVTDEVVGYEALLRWRRDDGIVPAGRFIALAEQTGLIHEIGHRVIDEVCAQAALVSARGDGGSYWSVNISSRQLAAAGFVDRVRESLRRHGFPARRLLLEITEPSTVGDGFEAWAALCELADLGVVLALDDFGLGWPLDSLRTLPVKAIKAERSFTASLTTDVTSRYVVQAMVDLAARLGVIVVAKCVETEEQRDAFRELGGRLAQGHLFSPARPPEALFGVRATVGGEEPGSASESLTA